MYKVLFNSCRAPVEIENWLNRELALGNKFIACNGDFYIFEAAQQGVQADGATPCAECGSSLPIVAGKCGNCGTPRR